MTIRAAADATELYRDRALGALLGGALGDALGMPTQLLSPDEIRKRYGAVEGFLAPSPDHPVSKGLPAGAVTDDTEQALLLAEMLLKGFEERAWAEALIEWEAGVAARGLLDLLGPSTKRALKALLAGEPAAIAGRYGDTNGAAMRIAPVGIMTPPEPLGALVDRVDETCRITHNTGLAIAAASAVAAAISVGVDGGEITDAISLAQRAAVEGADRGYWVAGADIAARIGWAVELAIETPKDRALDRIVALVGTSVAAQESVPAAFAVLTLAEYDRESAPWGAGLIAAGLGGDTDTIGAIAAGMAGACVGASALPAHAVATLRSVNDLPVERLVDGLLAYRLGAPT